MRAIVTMSGVIATIAVTIITNATTEGTAPGIDTITMASITASASVPLARPGTGVAEAGSG